MATNPYAVTIPPLPPPLQTNDMVQLGQLLNLRQEANERALKQELIRRQMADMSAMRDDYLRRERGMVSLQDLSNGSAQPQGGITQEPLSSPGPMWPGQPFGRSPGSPGAAAQAPVPMPEGSLGTYGPPTADAWPPSQAPVPVPPEAPPSGPPVQQPRPKSILEHYNDLEDMRQRYPFGFEVVGKQASELLKDHAAAQVQNLTMQKDAFRMVGEAADAVIKADPSVQPRMWGETYAMLRGMGLPGIEQLSPTFDPAQVGLLARHATTQEKQTDQAIAQQRADVEAVNARTAQREAETHAREAGIKGMQAGTEQQRMLNERYLREQGLAFNPKTGEAFTYDTKRLPGEPNIARPLQPVSPVPPGRAALPPPTPSAVSGGSPEGAGVPRPVPGTGGAVSVSPAAPLAPPGAPASVPVAPSPGGLTTPEQMGRQSQPGIDVRKQQLAATQTQADNSVRSLAILKEMKTLMHEGYVHNFKAEWLNDPNWQRLAIAGGANEDDVRRTATIRALAEEYASLSGGGGLPRGEPGIEQLRAGAGSLQKIPPLSTAMGIIESARRLHRQQIDRYNALAKEQNLPPATYQASPAMSKAQFEAFYQAARAKDPTLKRAKLAHDFEQGDSANGQPPVDVEGVYE